MSLQSLASGLKDYWPIIAALVALITGWAKFDAQIASNTTAIERNERALKTQDWGQLQSAMSANTRSIATVERKLDIQQQELSGITRALGRIEGRLNASD